MPDHQLEIFKNATFEVRKATSGGVVDTGIYANGEGFNSAYASFREAMPLRRTS